MTVVALPNRNTRTWQTAVIDLDAAVAVADHPRLTEHQRQAARLIATAGVPTRAWADRMAAITVIAERRADAAPTIARRAAYRDVADGAAHLLMLAEAVHSVRPVPAAQTALLQVRRTGRPAANG